MWNNNSSNAKTRVRSRAGEGAEMSTLRGLSCRLLPVGRMSRPRAVRAASDAFEDGMKVGLTLFGDLLNADGAKFAAQVGATHVVVHLTNYSRNADPSSYLAGGVGPILGNCSGERLW